MYLYMFIDIGIQRYTYTCPHPGFAGYAGISSIFKDIAWSVARTRESTPPGLLFHKDGQFVGSIIQR